MIYLTEMAEMYESLNRKEFSLRNVYYVNYFCEIISGDDNNLKHMDSSIKPSSHKEELARKFVFHIMLLKKMELQVLNL